MELKFDRARWQEDVEGCWLLLRVETPAQAKRFCEQIKPKKYVAKLIEHRERRSLDANAYLWVLITEIANALRVGKDGVYFEMLKRYGQGGVVKIPNDMTDAFQRAYPYHQKHETLPDEDRAQYYRFWVGSSQYNTQEMSILIDGVVSECKSLGIETATPEELARIKEEWA